MTTTDLSRLLSLPAGRELDAEVARALGIKVYNIEWRGYGDPQPCYYRDGHCEDDIFPVIAYSTDPREVVPLLEAVCGPRGWDYRIEREISNENGAVWYGVSVWDERDRQIGFSHRSDVALPVAACRAVLQAVANDQH